MNGAHPSTTDAEGPDGPDGPDSRMAQLGAILQGLRLDARLSLNMLSTQSGVSSGLLSQIERGIGNPSYTTLIKLAHTLRVNVGVFFGGEESKSQPATLVRGDQRRQLLLSERDLVYELLTPSLTGKLGMIQAQIAPGWSNESVPYVHEGEECVVITVGELTVDVSGTLYVLGPGDALTYDAAQPHWYWNRTQMPAVLIGAMTPPSF